MPIWIKFIVQLLQCHSISGGVSFPLLVSSSKTNKNKYMDTFLFFLSPWWSSGAHTEHSDINSMYRRCMCFAAHTRLSPTCTHAAPKLTTELTESRNTCAKKINKIKTTEKKSTEEIYWSGSWIPDLVKLTGKKRRRDVSMPVSRPAFCWESRGWSRERLTGWRSGSNYGPPL